MIQDTQQKLLALCEIQSLPFEIKISRYGTVKVGSYIFVGAITSNILYSIHVNIASEVELV